MKNIPFYKPSIGLAEIKEVCSTLKSGWLTTGPKVKIFESEFAKYLKHTHAIAVNSCTAALHLGLEASGIQEGDYVIVPTLTFAATAEVVRYLNAHVELVDCRKSDFNLDVSDAESKICRLQREGKRVSAIMPVHYGGQIGDMEGVRKLADLYDLKIVEDAAHCCPAFYRNGASDHWKTVGALSDICCFSFYANKTITTGEGGMACTDNDEYAERMRIMSLHGISKDAWKRFSKEGSWYYEIIAPGFKYNLSDIAASIGLHQLRKADRLHRRRRQLAQRYTQALQDLEEIVLPAELPNRIHSWHLYVIRIKPDHLSRTRAEIIEDLKNRGIGTSVHYLPLHMHPYYKKKYGYTGHDLPHASEVYEQIISLPLYPGMSDEDVDYVCRELRTIIYENRAKRIVAVPDAVGVTVKDSMPQTISQ